MMVMPDVNILLYAYDRRSKLHKVASKWLENALRDDEVVFSWHTVTGFIRIVTNPRVLQRPASIDQAVKIVGSWLERENAHLISLDKKNWPLLAEILVESQATGNLVMDAHLAASRSRGAKLASTDKDFTRFTKLQLIDLNTRP